MMFRAEEHYTARLLPTVPAVTFELSQNVAANVQGNSYSTIVQDTICMGTPPLDVFLPAEWSETERSDKRFVCFHGHYGKYYQYKMATGTVVIAEHTNAPCNPLLAAGIGTERFYLSTPFEYFPWLECRVAKPGWQDELGKLTDFDFRLVSAEKTRFLAIHHEEHWIDAYWCEL